MEKARYYPNFDWMRIFLALTVLVFHCTTRQGGFRVPGDFLAVPFFPVPAFLAISGFLVLQSYERTGSWLQFMIKRVLRIGPAFLAALVLVGLLLGAQAVPDALRTWYRLGMPLGYANAPLWSLGWEELFYLLLAILFALGAYRRPTAILAFWALSVVGFFGLLFLFKRTVLDIGAHLAGAFFLGNLFYLYRNRILGLRLNPWVPAGLLCFAIAIYPWRGTSLSAQSLHLILLESSVLLFCVKGPRLKLPKPPDLSYGIYIYHWPIMTMLLAHSIHAPLPLTLFTLLACVPLAAISWYGLERPALALKPRLKDARLQVNIPPPQRAEPNEA